MKSLRKLAILSLLLSFALSSLLPAPAMANPGVSCDINGDGVINLADIGIFAQLFFAGGYQARIDFNCDGVINLADIGIFATCF